MKIEKLAAIYVIVLGLVALAAAQFPSLMSDFVNVFFPVKADLSDIWFIRYRMSLFISATIILLFFVSYIWGFGFYNPNPENHKKLKWWWLLITVPMVPFFWLWFLPLGFCQVCWTRYDSFYFYLTVSLFLGLHILIQIISLILITFFRRVKRLR
jgi:hypothetical protein